MKFVPFFLIFIVSSVACTAAFAVSEESSPDLQQELLSAAPEVPAFPIADPAPLAWDSDKHPERKLWAKYAYSVVNQYFDELDLARDTPQFCKNYDKLTHEQKVQVFTAVMVGISYWETGWDPLNRTDEGGTIDEITHQSSVSEGLLQLSYADKINYTDLKTGEQYCPFDWDKDKNLSLEDPHRTILNPYINLYSGIRIMADSVPTESTHGEHALAANSYWSTLETGYNIHNRASSIEKSVRKLPFCGGHRWITPQGVVLDIVNRVQKAIKRAKE